MQLATGLAALSGCLSSLQLSNALPVSAAGRDGPRRTADVVAAAATVAAKAAGAVRLAHSSWLRRAQLWAASAAGTPSTCSLAPLASLTALRTLDIQLACPHGGGRSCRLRLEELTPLRQLRSFRADVGPARKAALAIEQSAVSIPVSNATLAELSTAWPGLQHLRLGLAHGDWQPSHAAGVPLHLHCFSRLRELGLACYPVEGEPWWVACWVQAPVEKGQPPLGLHRAIEGESSVCGCLAAALPCEPLPACSCREHTRTVCGGRWSAEIRPLCARHLSQPFASLPPPRARFTLHCRQERFALRLAMAELPSHLTKLEALHVALVPPPPSASPSSSLKPHGAAHAAPACRSQLPMQLQRLSLRHCSAGGLQLSELLTEPRLMQHCELHDVPGLGSA